MVSEGNVKQRVTGFQIKVIRLKNKIIDSYEKAVDTSQLKVRFSNSLIQSAEQLGD